jgi:PKD repeat protein
MATYYLNASSASQDGLTPETGYHTMGLMFSGLGPGGGYPFIDGDIIEIVNDIVEDSAPATFTFTTNITIKKYGFALGTKPKWQIHAHDIIFNKSANFSDIVMWAPELLTDWAYITLSNTVASTTNFTRCAFYGVYVQSTLMSGSLVAMKSCILLNSHVSILSASGASATVKIINNTFYGSFRDIWNPAWPGSAYDQLICSVPGKILNNAFYSNIGTACAWNSGNLPGGSGLIVDYNVTYTLLASVYAGIIPVNSHVPMLDFIGFDQFLELHNKRNVDPKLTIVTSNSYNPLPLPGSPCIQSGIGSDDESDVPSDDYNGTLRATTITEIGAIVVAIYPVFIGTPLSGQAPLSVAFTDYSTSTYGLIATYFWEFGDGTTSMDRSPVHTYTMPGKYTVSLTITDEIGYSAKITKTDYVTVYDADISGDHAAYTNKCYRLATTANQGISITEYGGDNWIWPPPCVGACKGYDGNDRTISIVLDNFTGKFYRVGISDLWKDRQNWPYGGYDIPCKFKLKEHVGQAGEYEQIKHIESHVYSRPFWEDNRDEPGFNSDGFIDGFEMDLQMYENGNPMTPAAKIQSVPQYGDYVYRRREEARRLQLEILTNASAFRIIGANQQMLCIDKKASPLLNNPVESQYQREFMTPYFWISRDKSRPTLNRATGRTCSGTYDLLLAGPDTIAKSAIAFAPAHSLTDDIADLSSDFTAGVWLNGIVGYPCVVFRITDGAITLDLSISAAGYMRWDDGTNVFSAAITWIGAGWVFVAWQKDGHYVRFFENGVQSTYYGMLDDSMIYGGTVSMPANSTITVFDPRITPRAVSSDALLYYYQKVLVDTGNEVLPIVR